MTRSAATEAAALDPYTFMATIGKRVIHPAAARPANIRKMAWLMPRIAKAAPYPGYVLVAAEKPRQASPASAS